MSFIIIQIIYIRKILLLFFNIITRVVNIEVSSIVDTLLALLFLVSVKVLPILLKKVSVEVLICDFDSDNNI